jgi:hypothetical protein
VKQHVLPARQYRLSFVGGPMQADREAFSCDETKGLEKRTVARLRISVVARMATPRRHCERSEAIQAASAERFWIASLRSQ